MEFEARIQIAINSYHERLDLIIWQSLSEEERTNLLEAAQ